ncbi:MAG: DUF481 domain-containing protein [Balneolales bacterium]|nr:DUF481 domain-containing protein [Balneolales bacterium]
MFRYTMLLIALTALSVINNTSFAQQNWWQTNSLHQDSLQAGWLFHTEGTYSLDRASGTISGFLHDGTGAVHLRNDRWLLRTVGEMKYQRISIGPNTIREKYFYIDGALVYDIVPRMHGEVGAIWEKDDANRIDQRLVSYAGLNYELVRTPRFGINALGAFGEQRKLRLGSSEVQTNFIGYFQQNMRVRITDRIFFTERFIWVHELGDDASYRYYLRLQAVFRFTPVFAGMIKHEIRYEEKAPAPGIDRLNQQLSIGFRFEWASTN